MSRIVFITGNARSLITSRGDIIAELSRRGHEVVGLVPVYGALPELADLGIHYELVDLDRPGMNPLRDVRSCWRLAKTFRRLAPEVVFASTIKPVIYGSIAAHLARVPRIVSMITGLGYLFTGDSPRQRFGRAVASALYRLALPFNKVVLFQNPDDLALFRQMGLVEPEQKAAIVHGDGVNLERFQNQPLPSGPVRFLMIARLLYDKGIVEFVEAARLVKREFPHVRFDVVGPHDPNLPRSVTSSELDAWRSEGHITFHGGVKDVRPYLASCSVFVLPSYREGTPCTILEAMASGRPIITTDVPGCRETVVPEANGLMVPPKDAEALALAMRRFIAEPSLVARMGMASREIAEAKYDVVKVNEAYIQHLVGAE